MCVFLWFCVRETQKNIFYYQHDIESASLWFPIRERPEKYLLLSAWRWELYGPGPQFLLFDRHEYIHTESSGL